MLSRNRERIDDGSVACPYTTFGLAALASVAIEQDARLAARVRRCWRRVLIVAPVGTADAVGLMIDAILRANLTSGNALSRWAGRFVLYDGPAGKNFGKTSPRDGDHPRDRLAI